jgi:hypothetical protein
MISHRATFILAQCNYKKLGDNPEKKWLEEETSRKKSSLTRRRFRMFRLKHMTYGILLRRLHLKVTHVKTSQEIIKSQKLLYIFLSQIRIFIESSK